MVKLARIVVIAIVENFGPDRLIANLSDPVWFQSLGCLLAFDWNASGLTTTTMGALKEAIKGLEKDLGLFICGGKGKASRKTPEQIMFWSEKINFSYEKATTFTYLSKLTAKVDSALIQDGFQIYHHNFIFSQNGQWGVIQQGMNIKYKKARRYHWYSEKTVNHTIEPHTGIKSQIILPRVLNLTSKKSIKNRNEAVKLVKDRKNLLYQIKLIKKNQTKLTLLNLSDQNFYSHPIENEKPSLSPLFSNKRIVKNLQTLTEQPIFTFEDLLMTKNVGPKTIRALSLISELVSGAKPSYEDPVRYSFSFGGKDGIPYPVDRKTYDQTIEIIEKAIRKSNLGYFEKEKLFRKNRKLFSTNL